MLRSKIQEIKGKFELECNEKNGKNNGNKKSTDQNRSKRN